MINNSGSLSGSLLYPSDYKRDSHESFSALKKSEKMKKKYFFMLKLSITDLFSVPKSYFVNPASRVLSVINRIVKQTFVRIMMT